MRWARTTGGTYETSLRFTTETQTRGSLTRAGQRLETLLNKHGYYAILEMPERFCELAGQSYRILRVGHNRESESTIIGMLVSQYPWIIVESQTTRCTQPGSL